MDSATLLHNIDPEDFKKQLLSAIDERFRALKAHLELHSGEEYLTRAETCRLLKISFPTLHSWEKKGILIKRELGGTKYFLRSEIHKSLLDSNNISKAKTVGK